MKVRNLVASMAIGFAAAGSAFALPSASTLWAAGETNTLSDDFVEVLIDITPPALGGAVGRLDVGDLLFTALGITSYIPNYANTSSSLVKELTILSAIQILSVGPTLNSSCGLPTNAANPAGTCKTFEFGAVAYPGGLGAVLAGFGFSLTGANNPGGLAYTPNSVAVVVEGDVHNFSINGPQTPAGFGAVVASGSDGNARAILDLDPLNGFDYWQANGPSTVGFFAISPGKPGGSAVGNFAVDLTISGQAFPGWDMGTDLVGSGTLRRGLTTTASLVSGDASFSFLPTSVPEPGSLALIGLGLLGLAASRRKTTPGSTK